MLPAKLDLPSGAAGGAHAVFISLGEHRLDGFRVKALTRVKGKDSAMLFLLPGTCPSHISQKDLESTTPTFAFCREKKSKNQMCRQEPCHHVSLSMMARGLVMPDLALGAHYRHDPRQGGEDPKEKKTIGETHFLAHGEIQLCQQSFICNTCSEHRWEFSAWICSQQLVIQCDDSGLSVSLQAKAAQTLLRQNFHFS